ncbi:transcriptional regulator [Sporosarcina sp. GW1-11]|uniref:transcriptional regulator n=1 Tax=Sporosarcina sp. GW1-11 TaxID=2899126 RepID=UPI00294C4BC2|nr:transcriptional regulator [Sporosarcina sp. GW1-11]MDV6378239.1 transcriptional regulator [Sporosarcina sp. GW1-11]
MLLIQRIKPFFTRKEEFNLRLVFAYQYFSIIRNDEVFQFIPAEGKEIVINTKSLQIENLGEIFVFQRGHRFIRIPLYQLLLISDLHLHLSTILEGAMGLEGHLQEGNMRETDGLVEQLERENWERMVDYALETKNRLLFKELMEGLRLI